MTEKQFTDRDIVLADLRAGNTQDSFDWPADLRFAKAVGLTDHVRILLDMEKGGVWPIMWNFHRSLVYPVITRRRLRALQKLVRDGLVFGFWIGTGPGGLQDSGTKRIRGYSLREAGKQALDSHEAAVAGSGEG